MNESERFEQAFRCLYVDSSGDVWKVVCYIDQPSITIQSVLTFEKRTIVLGSMLEKALTKYVKEG